MNDFGEMSETGSVLSKSEMRERRKKRGECETCGIKCFEKHLFKTIPITVNDAVLEGRCLRCHPLTILEKVAQDTSHENHRKSARLSWRMGKFFRSNSDNTLSVKSGDSHAAVVSFSDADTTIPNVVNPSAVVSFSDADTTIPTTTSCSEFVIEEEEEITSGSQALKHDNVKSNRSNNKTLYSQAIAGAAALQMQQAFRHRKEASAEMDREKGAITSSQSLTRNSAQSVNSYNVSSPERKQNTNDRFSKGVEVKKSSRLSAREQSIQMNERIEKKLRNATVPAATTKQAAIHSSSKNSLQPIAVDIDDNQILRKMERQGCTYEDILDIATLYPSRLRVQQRAINLLSKFDLNDFDLTKILNIDGYKTIVFGGMENSPNEKEIQLNGCSIILKISETSNSNKLAATRAGCIELTLNVMSNFPNDKRVQNVALMILSNLCHLKEVQLSVFNLGGVKTIVQAMTTHHTCNSIQASSCTALSHLAGHSHSMKTTINAARACEQISIAMVENNSLEFTEKALDAIRAICIDHNENKLSAVKSGVTDSIVSSMQIHRDAAEMQAAAALTIMHLGYSEVTAPMIGENGGIDLMVRAMWQHSDNLDVQRSTCESLFVLSSNAENQALIADISGIAAVISAMQNFVDDAGIQQHSCGILANVAQLDDCIRARIVADEALDAITLTMVVHANNVKVQDKACLVLRNLVCASNLDPLRASNVIELIKSAGCKFPAECRENAINLCDLLSDELDNPERPTYSSSVD